MRDLFRVGFLKKAYEIFFQGGFFVSSRLGSEVSQVTAFSSLIAIKNIFQQVWIFTYCFVTHFWSLILIKKNILVHMTSFPLLYYTFSGSSSVLGQILTHISTFYLLYNKFPWSCACQGHITGYKDFSIYSPFNCLITHFLGLEAVRNLF